MDWYYKRYKVVGILLSTELFMLTDRSPGYKETYDFLERRLVECEKGEELIASISDTLFGLWTAKNSFIEMLKRPKVNMETREMKGEASKNQNDSKQ